MLAELFDAIKAARDSEDVRAVVLTGAGDRSSARVPTWADSRRRFARPEDIFASDLFLEFFRLMPRSASPRSAPPTARPGRGDGAGSLLRPGDRQEGATFGTPEINVGAFPYMIMAIIYRKSRPRRSTR